MHAIHRPLLALAAAAIGLVAFASPVAAQVNCCRLPNQTITGFINDDVVAANCGCTVARTANVNGNIEQTGDGSLVIRGIVNGGVSEAGPGNLTIDRGIVGGDCAEADGGSLVVRQGSFVNGLLQEAGTGGVTVTVGVDGPTKGDVIESGAGSVVVTVLGGAYEGGLFEEGAGSATVSVAAGSAFKGDIEEQDDGSVTATVEGILEGNVRELFAGNLVTEGSGWFKGNTEHEIPGLCSNSIARFEGSACVPL